MAMSNNTLVLPSVLSLRSLSGAWVAFLGWSRRGTGSRLVGRALWIPGSLGPTAFERLSPSFPWLVAGTRLAKALFEALNQRDSSRAHRGPDILGLIEKEAPTVQAKYQ